MVTAWRSAFAESLNEGSPRMHTATSLGLAEMHPAPCAVTLAAADQLKMQALTQGCKGYLPYALQDFQTWPDGAPLRPATKRKT